MPVFGSGGIIQLPDIYNLLTWLRGLTGILRTYCLITQAIYVHIVHIVQYNLTIVIY